MVFQHSGPLSKLYAGLLKKNGLDFDENNEQTGTWSGGCHRENLSPLKLSVTTIVVSDPEDSFEPIWTYKQRELIYRSA